MAGTPPSQLVATVISPYRINVSWKNNDPGYNYHFVEVWRNYEGGSYEKIEELEGSAEFYEDHNLTSEKIYCFYESKSP